MENLFPLSFVVYSASSAPCKINLLYQNERFMEQHEIAFVFIRVYVFDFYHGKFRAYALCFVFYVDFIHTT